MRRAILAGTVVATLLAAAQDRELRVDFNGDNLDDLAIGAPGEDLGVHADAGAVNVQHGSAGGPAGDGQVLSQGTPEGGDRFGQALAKGRFFNDFNGDAFSDLAVGVPLEDVVARPDAGLVSLLEGSAADGLVGSAAVLVQGAEAGDVFGVSVE
jgi:hypothetical protein